jgi:hypothetical protein
MAAAGKQGMQHIAPTSRSCFAATDERAGARDLPLPSRPLGDEKRKISPNGKKTGGLKFSSFQNDQKDQIQQLTKHVRQHTWMGQPLQTIR